jgi:hypothetical protein
MPVRSGREPARAARYSPCALALCALPLVPALAGAPLDMRAMAVIGSGRQPRADIPLPAPQPKPPTVPPGP